MYGNLFIAPEILGKSTISPDTSDLGAGTVASVVITGICVVFIALILLILFVSIYGKIFVAINKKSAEKAKAAKAAEEAAKAKKAEETAKSQPAPAAAPAPPASAPAGSTGTGAPGWAPGPSPGPPHPGGYTPWTAGRPWQA